MAPEEHSDEKDALWDLLGQARGISASPFFSAKVMREIERQEPRVDFVSLMRRWLPVPVFAAIAVAMAFSVAGYQQQHDSEVAAFNKQLDAITGIDSLAPASEDTLAFLSDGEQTSAPAVRDAAP